MDRTPFIIGGVFILIGAMLIFLAICRYDKAIQGAKIFGFSKPSLSKKEAIIRGVLLILSGIIFLGFGILMPIP